MNKFSYIIFAFVSVYLTHIIDIELLCALLFAMEKKIDRIVRECEEFRYPISRELSPNSDKLPIASVHCPTLRRCQADDGHSLGHPGICPNPYELDRGN